MLYDDIENKVINPSIANYGNLNSEDKILLHRLVESSVYFYLKCKSELDKFYEIEDKKSLSYLLKKKNIKFEGYKINNTNFYNDFRDSRKRLKNYYGIC